MTLEEFIGAIDNCKIRLQTNLPGTVWTLHVDRNEPIYIRTGGKYTLAQRRTLTELFALAEHVLDGRIIDHKLIDDDPYADRRQSRPIKVLI